MTYNFYIITWWLTTFVSSLQLIYTSLQLIYRSIQLLNLDTYKVSIHPIVIVIVIVLILVVIRSVVVHSGPRDTCDSECMFGFAVAQHKEAGVPWWEQITMIVKMLQPRSLMYDHFFQRRWWILKIIKDLHGGKSKQLKGCWDCFPYVKLWPIRR